MPTLLETRQIHIEFADLNRMYAKHRTYNGPRSSGLHLSGIIKYVLESGGLLTPDELGDLMPLRMCVGMAWEQWVVQLWPEMIWQPGEYFLDGIYGSPDGITPTKDGTILEEIKATWLSRLDKSEKRGVTPPARDILKQKRWMLQLAGYLKMLGLKTARMHVLFVDGDYRGSGPQYFTYLLEFTQAELDRTWCNLILPNREGAKAEDHAQ